MNPAAPLAMPYPSAIRDNRPRRGIVGEFLRSEIQPGSHLSFVMNFRPANQRNLRPQFVTSSLKILPLLQSPPDPPKREIGFRVEEGRGKPYRSGAKTRKKQT